ncbi:hypothetical protein E2C01_012839 [Portunus trituberculatus]|uniref:Uncharacterized protein n=1 Tax=Portunus trituberculatus TaxID=210409 RepID=A0A5B7DFP0_PORTR|nr:hypothetical protein [Portunus trituberculatus]
MVLSDANSCLQNTKVLKTLLRTVLVKNWPDNLEELLSCSSSHPKTLSVSKDLLHKSFNRLIPEVKGNIVISTKVLL